MSEYSPRLVEHLSASSIKKLDACRFSWYLNYIHKLPFEDSYATMNGKMLHKVCEEYGRASNHIAVYGKKVKRAKGNKLRAYVRFIERCKRFLDYEARVYHYYHNTWEPHKYARAKEFIDVEKDCENCPYWDKANDFCNVTNENIELFEGCPKGLIDNSLKLIRNVFESEHNPLNCKILDFEKKFLFKLENGVPIKGYIDMVCELDEETLEVKDWKFGKYALTRTQAERDIQLLMYGIAAKRLYPKYKYITCTLEYPKYYPNTSKKPGLVDVTFDEDDLIEGEARILEAWDSVHTEELLERSYDFVRCNYMCVKPEKCNKLWKEISGKSDRI